MIMALMDGWNGSINDVQGSFLKRRLNQKTKKIAIKVPQDFEKYYDENVVLLLLMEIYGTM